MARSPQELKQSLQGINRTRFEQTCREIEKEMDEWDGKSKIYVYGSINEIVIQLVRDEYEKAGWLVSYHQASDQRDDDYLIFEDYGQ